MIGSMFYNFIMLSHYPHGALSTRSLPQGVPTIYSRRTSYDVPQIYETMSNPDSHTTQQTKQSNKGGLFSWARPHGRTKSKAPLPDPSPLHQYSLSLRPTRSTSKRSATLPPVPREPLPQVVHQTHIRYPILARVETAMLLHSAFPSRLSGRRAAVRQIHPSHPYRVIVKVSHQVIREPQTFYFCHPTVSPQRGISSPLASTEQAADSQPACAHLNCAALICCRQYDDFYGFLGGRRVRK
jgi:hypothetical protein